MRRKPIIIRRKPTRRKRKNIKPLSPSKEASKQMRTIIDFIDENMKNIDANISRDLNNTYQYLDNSFEENESENDSTDPKKDDNPNSFPEPQLGLDDSMLAQMPQSVKESIQQVQRSIEQTSASIYKTIESNNLTLQNVEVAENKMVQEIENSQLRLQSSTEE